MNKKNIGGIERKGGLQIIGMNVSHSNWEDIQKIKDFKKSLRDFHQMDYPIYEESTLKKHGINDFLYVGKYFVAFREVSINIFEISPYIGKKEFSFIAEGLVEKYEKVGIFIPFNQHRKELNELVQKAANECNMLYEGNIMRYKPEEIISLH